MHEFHSSYVCRTARVQYLSFIHYKFFPFQAVDVADVHTSPIPEKITGGSGGAGLRHVRSEEQINDEDNGGDVSAAEAAAANSNGGGGAGLQHLHESASMFSLMTAAGSAFGNNGKYGR